MEIIDISEFKTNKVKVLLDNEIAFVLYKGDLSKYDLKIGQVEDKVIDEIINEVLYKRAMNRALGIVGSKDVTSFALKNKLTDEGYTENVSEKVLQKLIDERLINDDRFVRGYIESKSEKKSKSIVIRELVLKGFDKDYIEKIYDELQSDNLLKDESVLIGEILLKKHFDTSEATYEDKGKMFRYLMGKGFSYDSIRSALSDE